MRHGWDTWGLCVLLCWLALVLLLAWAALAASVAFARRRGQAGSNVWRNVDKVFIVNGHIEMADANFVGGLSFDKIGNTGIFIGPYPQLE